ncbi:MAG: VOC family protein [Holophagales bacterium]|nr:VOC family protein [Holophagales bacterium]
MHPTNPSPTLPPFHLAFPVTDLDATRRFYGELLGCRMGRSAETWVDFELHGHQISAHLRREAAGSAGPGVALHNPVDGKQVPVPHFGLVLPWEAWQALAERLRAAGIEFVIEPYVRFEGQPGEQGTFFLLDPSGNALEFKSFKDPSRIFATA